MSRDPPRVTGVAARFAFSAAVLLLVATVLDVGEVVARLSRLSVGWVALGLGISVLQIVTLAWRWRFTAGRLGIELPMRRALGEYYLGLLLNQVLPGGVMGDVSRAWRHVRMDVPAGPAVRAVILERLSGQVVMTVVAITSFLSLPWVSGVARLSAAAVTVALVGVLLLGRDRGPVSHSLAGRIRADADRAVLAGDALPFQVATALLAVGSYVAVYLVAARAVGVDTPTLRLLPLVAPVLMTMLIPVTVAGWGVREGAAAALWSLAGLTPEDGVAISVAYGLLALLSSTPGLPVLTRSLLAGRDRRGGRTRGGSGDTEDGAPDRGSRSGPT